MSECQKPQWSVLGLGKMREKGQKREVNRNLSVANIYTKFCLS
jgi:hypothetical protein